MSKRKMKSVNNILCLLFLMLISLILISGGKADARIKLKTKIPDLCYGCHEELKKNLSDPHVHPLFKRGECMPCHDSHVSNIKGLIVEQIDSICLNCHEKIRNLLKKATLHTALRDNLCTDCHYSHSGENKYLLTMPEKPLCLNCHEGIKEQFKKAYACLPFKEGKCSSCHNPHASAEGDLLISSPNKLCQKCHGPRCKAGKVSISSVVKDSDCTSCHSGHSSKDKGILGPYGHTVFLIKKCEECHNPITAKKKITTKIEGADLCFNCHKRDESKYQYVENDIHVKDAKNPCTICHDYHASGNRHFIKNESRLCINCHEKTEKRTASMEKALGSIKCAPVKNRKCFDCHIPTHSDRPLNYRADPIAMCARCHESQHKITHPLGNDVIDVRNGEPVTCISCHSMHSAKAEFMLTHEKDRAICIQCHKM